MREGGIAAIMFGLSTYYPEEGDQTSCDHERDPIRRLRVDMPEVEDAENAVAEQPQRVDHPDLLGSPTPTMEAKHHRSKTPSKQNTIEAKQHVHRY
jgi:hypothetical protein